MRRILILLALFAPGVLAQMAELSGFVKDPTGAVVPSASIELRNQGTGIRQKASTNSAGVYTLTALKPGAYQATVQAQGFKTLTREGIVLEVDQRARLDLTLAVGSLEERVTVEGGAPLNDLTDGSVSTVVDRGFVENLPLNGRSFQSLIALAPGVVLTTANSSQQGQFSVNGQRADANYFTVDGVSANTGINGGIALDQSGGGTLPGLTAAGGTNGLVSVDALQEFRIETSSFAPEFGRMPGGQVSIVTRSGGSEFHGSLFEYFRNDALDAKDWFANQQGLAKPALRQNDFGGVLGGPVLLPGLGSRRDGTNRTFFFFSYEGLRLRQPVVGITEVPSLATRQAAVPVVRPFLNAFPIPNGPDTLAGLSQFAASFSNPSTLNATSIRADHTFGNSVTLFGRYNHAPSETALRGSGYSLNTVTQLQMRIQTLTLGSTQILTHAITNDLRVNYSVTTADSFNTLDTFGGAAPPALAAFFPSFVQVDDALMSFVIATGRQNRFVVGKNTTNKQRQFNLVDSLSVRAASHSIKAGVDYRRMTPLRNARGYSLLANFASVTAAVNSVASNALIQSSTDIPIGFTNLSLYVQDAWHLSRRFALTYGLRWEDNPPPGGLDGRTLYTVLGSENPATMTLAPAGTPLYSTTTNNVAPRVGASYLLSAKTGWETVLRGGAGLFYDLANGVLSSASGSVPYLASKTLANVPFPLTDATAAPLPFGLTPPYTIRTSDPNLKLPYTYQWNVTAEQTMAANQTLRLSYVGALGRRLIRTESNVVIQQINPNFNGFVLVRNSADSNYQALQAQLRRRLSRGLQAQLAYTWSKSLDTVSNDYTFGAPLASYGIGRDRAPSDFDTRQSFRAAVSYSAPNLRRGGVAAAMLRDWSADGIFTARTATPVDVLYSRNIGFGSYTFRPDPVAGVPVYIYDSNLPGGRRINSAAFRQPVEARQGWLGRNALRGFGLSQIDFAVRRQFRLAERVRLQFRGEFFNLFNHPNFGAPVATLTDGLFGRATQTLGNTLGSGGVGGGLSPLYQVGGPRSMQATMRLTF